MQRYGPPPSYPYLKIPGLNAPLPDGSGYGGRLLDEVYILYYFLNLTFFKSMVDQFFMAENMKKNQLVNICLLRIFFK